MSQQRTGIKDMHSFSKPLFTTKKSRRATPPQCTTQWSLRSKSSNSGSRHPAVSQEQVCVSTLSKKLTQLEVSKQTRWKFSSFKPNSQNGVNIWQYRGINEALERKVKNNKSWQHLDENRQIYIYWQDIAQPDTSLYLKQFPVHINIASNQSTIHLLMFFSIKWKKKTLKLLLSYSQY